MEPGGGEGALALGSEPRQLQPSRLEAAGFKEAHSLLVECNCAGKLITHTAIGQAAIDIVEDCTSDSMAAAMLGNNERFDLGDLAIGD